MDSLLGTTICCQECNPSRKEIIEKECIVLLAFTLIDYSLSIYYLFPNFPAEGQLKEWVSLQGEGDKVPKIRTARPVTIMRYEGTRKRRRAAMGDYNWSVGDRVDAWIRDRCV